MKTLSRWAHRHVALAILLLIGCEVTNGFVGILLGANALPDHSLSALPILLAVGVGVGVWIRIGQPSPQPYRQQRLRLFGAFTSTFLLWVLMGGLWGQRVQQPSGEWAAWGSRKIEHSRTDTVGVSATAAPNTTYRQTQTEKKHLKPQQAGQGGKRWKFIVLTLLGFGLAYVAAGVACNLACSGYGFLSVLTVIAGLGALAGGIFFLTRAFEKPIVPMPERSETDQRRLRRRFWLLWIGAIAATGLAFLISALAGK